MIRLSMLPANQRRAKGAVKIQTFCVRAGRSAGIEGLMKEPTGNRALILLGRGHPLVRA